MKRHKSFYNLLKRNGLRRLGEARRFADDGLTALCDTLGRTTEFNDHGDDDMDAPSPFPVFRFGEFQFDRRGGGLFRIAGDRTAVAVPLGSRAVDLLAVLLERQGVAAGGGSSRSTASG